MLMSTLPTCILEQSHLSQTKKTRQHDATEFLAEGKNDRASLALPYGKSNAELLHQPKRVHLAPVFHDLPVDKTGNVNCRDCH